MSDEGYSAGMDARVDKVLAGFDGNSFTTAQFIDAFGKRFPKTWNAVVSKYGQGGKGTGTVYTSSSFVGTHLEKRKYNRTLLKLDRVRSPPGWGNAWITVWANLGYSGGTLYPDEIPDSAIFTEGTPITVTVNRYERDAAARKACIRHHGASCKVCRMDFGSIYGPTVEGFIHVHHVKPLSTIGRRYRVDPKADLRPVCPNCHAVIHAKGKVLSIPQARALLRKMARHGP